jgi:superfamily II DNA or RNA helicase
MAKLLPFQITHADLLLNSIIKYNIGISAADTGTGKTYISIHIAKELKLKPLIICPKSVIYSWLDVIKKFNIEYYGITNYELIKNYSYYDNSNGNKLGKKIKCSFINKDYTFNLPDDSILIFDEVHKCKNKKTINSKLLLNIDIKTINYKLLLLSATLSDTIENFAVFATVLKLCPHIDLYNMYMKKKYDNNLCLIHKLVFPEFGGRMKLRDIKDLPDNIILPEKYYMDNATEIQAQYELINLVATIREDQLNEANIVLEKILRARQRIEALKVYTIIDLINSSLENNLSVVVFVNFKNTIALITNEIPIKCQIHGEQSMKDRQTAIDLFQSNKERIIICTIQAGGVGINLHDTDGNFPRISIISPSWSAQDLIQSLGRIYRAGLKSKAIQKIVYCADTIEEDIANIIQQKLNNYASLNEGKKTSEIKL